MKSYFQNKVIIITGASAGIGRELSVQFSKQGAFLALASRNINKLNEIANMCIKNGAKVICIPTDIRIQTQCEALINTVIQQFGRIDILINNAGTTMTSVFDDKASIELIKDNIETNFFGSVYCTYYALPYLKESRGSIVGIASLSAKWAFPTKSGYVASKHAMMGFFDSLRIELKDTDVKVIMIYPSFVATGTRSAGRGIMSVERCAFHIIKAIVQKRREYIMTLAGKLGLILKLISPKLLDGINSKMMQNKRLSSR